jgi:hypothetical protein
MGHHDNSQAVLETPVTSFTISHKSYGVSRRILPNQYYYTTTNHQQQIINNKLTVMNDFFNLTRETFSVRVSQHPKTVTNVLIVLVACGTAIVTAFSFDKININQGFGYDPIYGEIAQDFYGQIQGLNQFYFARILPSLIIYHIGTLFTAGSILDSDTVILGYEILRVMSLGLAGYAWCLIADALEIGTSGKWLGFIGLFFNYAILKDSSYMPVRADSIGFALGLLMLYAYLANKKILLHLLTFLGAFTWSSMLFLGSLLILFPTHPNVEPVKSRSLPYYMHFLIALLPTLAAFIYMIKIVPGDLDPNNMGEPIEALRQLSAILAASYIFLGLSELLNYRPFYSRKYLMSFFLKGSFYLSLLFLIGLQLLPNLLAPESGNPMTLGNILYLVILTSILQPGIFLVSHVVYWGPFFILAVLLWKPVCRIIHGHGLGITLWMVLGLIESLDSESRHLMIVFPLLIPFVVKVLEGFSWNKQKILYLMIISLLSSKFWLQIGEIGGRHREFPTQYLYMSHGPWMSDTMYIAQGAIVAVLFFILYLFYVQQPQCLSEHTNQ